MTEVEWDACTNPQKMLGFLWISRKASIRKVRLLFGACCSRIPQGTLQGLTRPTRASADGCEAGGSDPAAFVGDVARVFFGAVSEVLAALGDRSCEGTALFRDIFGHLPFRPLSIDPALLAWNAGTVVRLAQAIYDERVSDLMPILADALEDAGCDNADILSHLRGPGPHVRGCWVVDLLLGKE